MAFVRLAFFPGGTEEQYLALAWELKGAPVPSARLLFAAGPVPNGWQVVQIWDSREELVHFNEQWLFSAMDRTGSAGFSATPEVTDFHTRDLWLGATHSG